MHLHSVDSPPDPVHAPHSTHPPSLPPATHLHTTPPPLAHPPTYPHPLWSGIFALTGAYKNLTTHMHAIPRSIPGLPQLLDLSFLPPRIECNVTMFRHTNPIRHALTLPDSRWYVQFVLPPDVDPEVASLVRSVAHILIDSGPVIDVGRGFYILGARVGGVECFIGALAGGPVWGIHTGFRRVANAAWRSFFCLSTPRNTCRIPCMFSLQETDVIGDAKDWPSWLLCDVTAVKEKKDVGQGKVMTISPVEESRRDLTRIAELFVRNGWMFEIEYGQRIFFVMGRGNPGEFGAELIAVCKRIEVRQELVQQEVNSSEVRRVWNGVLRIKGQRADAEVRCAAVQYGVRKDDEMMDGSGWPEELVFEVDAEKGSETVEEEMNGAQWYVRFVGLDENGREKEQDCLKKLAEFLEKRDSVFVSACMKPGGTTGLLYMWGSRIPPHGLSLLGVFAPS